MKKKSVALLLALVLVFGAAIGGTIAYLMDTTAKIDNVFTVGKVDIDLTETEREYKMTPGQPLDKDPTVTVKANSEACWVFVKVEKTNNPDTYLDYEIDEAWTPLTDVEGVYYIEQAATTAEVPYAVLAGNTVTVKEGVTNAMMDTANENPPKLSFTAYAIQKAGFADAAAAWTELNKTA